MAAVTSPESTSGLGAAAMDKDLSQPQPAQMSQVHTPPTTDEASHKDDDAASSSSLSDLGDDIDLDEENRMRFEDAARAGAEAEQYSEVKPDRYENGVPVFTPTMDQFKDFQKYVKGVDPFGMQSGIVLIDPPEEWKRARKALDEAIRTIKIKNPITQEFHGAQGIYTQRNMEKMRSYNLPQWKSICEQTENQPPAKRGEKRMNADKLLGRGTTKNRKSEPVPTLPGMKRKPGRPRVKPIKEEPVDRDFNILAPPTPTSPDVKPGVSSVDDDDNREESVDPTPTKGKRGPKPGPKPRGRPPKNAKRETGKSTETTVAARRLRNAREANDVIDEEAFKDFDYRVYDNDQWTPERCDELEEKYWKSLNFSNPMYAADMPGSLFDEDTKEWNIAKLPNLLDLLGQPIPGVNTAYLYLGMWRATFAWHLEDVDLYSINYIHFGAPKQWYSISQRDAPKFEAAMKSLWTSDAKNCDQFLRHKTYLVSPALLKSKYGVTVNKIVHREGQFVITFPIGYHSGYNLGYNCAESVNFAIENWLQYGKTARKCQCEADSVFIDVDWFVRRFNGEPSPEYEEVEVTDDEDEDEPIDLPTPPGSDRGKVKMSQKRKRSVKSLGPNKKLKKIVKIRKVSKNQPCCLCPNDFAWEELLPTSHGQKAHRTCAMYTPETYLATQDGKEMVFNVENISKARLELKCYECRQKKGSCFQCSSAKCTRSYHATCAMQAGVQVDKGEIAVWHEGVEYRDVGFDWRCRLHRTVKKSRVTSELSACNHSNHCWSNQEFKSYIANLKPGELIQYQSTHLDEIEAGVVVSDLDVYQNSILVRVLPDQRVVKEVDPAWILFVDSGTSCLQKPSANALELPEELQGKTASLPESTERKPSEGDPFTENPKTEWAEFVSATPPYNKAQKPVDLTKEKQLWHYIGKSSTESKAHFTLDPTNPVHDPASVFLETVEPLKATMAPPPQPRRQSLAATYPSHGVQARSSVPIVSRSQSVALPPGQNIMSIASKGSFVNTDQEKTFQSTKVGPKKGSQYRDLIVGIEARANEQARILQRQQAKAQQLDMRDGSFVMNNPSIGIDRGAVERQRQFQQYGSQQSKTMDQWAPNPTLPTLKQYQDTSSSRSPAPFAPGYNGQPMISGAQGRTQQLNFSNDWMNPSVSYSHSSFNIPSGHFPQVIHHAQDRASTGKTPSTFPPYIEQPHTQFQSHSKSAPSQFPILAPAFEDPVQQHHIMSQSDISRPATSSGAVPPSSAEVERRRRISNPAYPFKSPDQIKAQKEADKISPPGSRPGSSYKIASPMMKQEGYIHSAPTGSPITLDPQNPPQFINPNATQISPPGTSAGRRNSISGLPTVMGPPIQPQLKQAHTLDPLNSLPPYIDSNISNYVPRRSMFDPANRLTAFQTVPQPIPQPRSFLLQPFTPMADLSEQLVDTLQQKRLGPHGLPQNDRMIAAQVSDWHIRGGFWAKVASYYTQKHQGELSVYRSPFATIKDEGNVVVGLADRYYDGLQDVDKKKVDEVKHERRQSA